jgi:hypothetical protein
LSQVRGSPWAVNLYVPEDIPYWEALFGVICRYCGRRVKRRKIWEHVRREHAETELSPFVPDEPKP